MRGREVGGVVRKGGSFGRLLEIGVWGRGLGVRKGGAWVRVV